MKQQTLLSNASLFSPRSSSELTTIEESSRGFRGECLLNEWYYKEGKIRLAKVRSNLDYNILDLKDIALAYEEWVSQDEGFVIMSDDPFTGEREYLGVKCSKRGNDVYRWRVENRLKDIKQAFDDNEIIFFTYKDQNPDVQCLAITLTYDTKRCSLAEAWENFGIEYNRFVSRLTKNYGKVSIFRAWEAFENGYPHVHLIAMFHDHKFSGFRHKADDVRIQEKDEVAEAWHSFVDVSAVENLNASAQYLIKYITKVNNHSEPKHTTTLSMMWLYGKRAFGISRDFAQQMETARLEFALHNSNQKRAIQTDLEGKILKKTYTFVGMYDWNEIKRVRCKDKLSSPREAWAFKLTGVPKD